MNQIYRAKRQPDRLGLVERLRYSRQSRASVSGDQASVRACEGALPRAQEEYGAALHVVCAVQFVDVARPVDGSASGSVLPNPESTPHSAPNTRLGGKGDGISVPIESKFHYLKITGLVLEF